MKRAKGKERKAKAEAQRVVTGEGGWEQLVRWGVCKHECTLPPSDGHIVSAFLNGIPLEPPQAGLDLTEVMLTHGEIIR